MRLYPKDADYLKTLKKSLNEGRTGRKITKTDIVRGLLKIGAEMPTEKLLKKILEV